VVLTDYEFSILSLLRTVAPTEDVKFAVKETYNMQLIHHFTPITKEVLLSIIQEAQPTDNVKKVFNLKLGSLFSLLDFKNFGQAVYRVLPFK